MTVSMLSRIFGIRRRHNRRKSDAVSGFNYGAVGEPVPSTAADIVQVYNPRYGHGYWVKIDRTHGLILERSERRFAGVPEAARKKPLASRREAEAAEARRRATKVESRGNGE